MPTTYVVANRASNTLSAGLSANPVTIAVTDASTFPSPSAGQACLVFVRAAADSAETGVYAVYQYTSRASNTLSGVTYVSGTNGAGGGTWTSGDTVAVRDVAELVTKFSQIDANESITGTKTFADAALVLSGAARMAVQTTLPTSPTSSQRGLFLHAVDANARFAHAALRDAFGDTNRTWPYNAMARRPSRGARISFTTYDISGVFRGYGVDVMSSTTAPSAGAVAAAQTGTWTEARRSMDTGTGVNAVAGVCSDTGWSSTTVRNISRGSVAGRGGFAVSHAFELRTLTAVARVLSGLHSSGASALLLANDPSFYTADSYIVLGADTADTNLTLMVGSGTNQVKIPFDTPRSKTAASGCFYTLTLECLPNASSIYVRVEEWSATGYAPTVLMSQVLVDDGTTTVNGVVSRLPANTAFMRQICAVGAAAGVIAQVICPIEAYAEVLR